ncbi:MAG: hypothetical protein U0163_00395 [Gemmatimonadaceae bacterium]
MYWFISLLASASVSAVLTSALVWLSKTWISERLKGAIQHEYDQKLEALKAELKAQNDVAVERLKASNAQMLSVHTSASNTFTAIHGIAHERRLKGIEALWLAVDDVRKHVPMAVELSDLFSEDNYSQYFSRGAALESLTELDVEYFHKLFKDAREAVEHVRPFVGENLYQLFRAYHFIPHWIAQHLWRGFDEGNITSWHDETHIRQLVSGVPTLTKTFDQAGARYHYVSNIIEQKMLEKASRIISGGVGRTRARLCKSTSPKQSPDSSLMKRPVA